MDRRRENPHVKMTSVKGLVDGQEEGRTGLHVENDVVLKCEGNNNEGACDMLCLMWRMTVLWDTMNPDSMTQVLSHARKITCAGVRRMRGLSVVFTRRFAYCGTLTLSFRFECHHLASVSLKVRLSAPVSWCWKILCHLLAALENIFGCLGCCFASVSYRKVKRNSDPTLDFPGSLESCGRVFFALRRFLDTKFIGLGFATAEPSFHVLSWAHSDMTLCFLFERKWLQENIEKFMMFNKRRRWSHSSRVKFPVVNMSASWFLVPTYFDLDYGVQVDFVR